MRWDTFNEHVQAHVVVGSQVKAFFGQGVFWPMFYSAVAPYCSAVALYLS